MKMNGAQDARFVQRPDISLVSRHADAIRMITLAPELEGARGFVQQIKENHPEILLSIGHSLCDYKGAVGAFADGIRHVTHLFNAMSPYHHRAPGIVGAFYDTHGVTADLIADLIHTHPHHLKMAHKIKRDSLALITDATRAGCLKDGIYELGGQSVELKDKRVTLKDGTIAGSVLRMNEAIRNFMHYADATMQDALYAASALPAQIIGEKKRGQLKVGHFADIVIFDKNLNITKTFVEGKLVYDKDDLH